MSTERIDEIISQKAIDGFEKLTINVNKALTEIEKLIATGVDLNKALGGANSFKGANDGIAKMTENQKALAKQTAALEAAQAKLNLANSDQEKKLAILKLQQQEAAKASKEQAKEALGLVDAYAKLEKQYIKSARETQNFAVQFGIADEKTKASAKSTQELYNKLIEADKAVGKFGRNVGNYPTTFQSLGDVGRESLEKINNGFKDLIKNVAAAAVAFIGIHGIFEFGKESLEAFEDAETKASKLENTLKNLSATQKDIGLLKDSIKKLTEVFPYLQADDLVDVQQKLIIYGKLTAKQINDLTPTIINFAASQSISISEAADVITRSLEGNGRALKTYGINLTDAKTETERFNIIQTELGRRVEGAGEAFAETSGGKAAIYKKQLHELKEDIGGQLLPVYEEFLKVSIKVIGAIRQLDFGNIIKGIGLLVGIWIAYRAAVLTASIVTAFNTAAQIANRAASIGSTVAVAAQTLAEETNGKVKNANIVITYALIAVQRIYNATVSELAGPIGIILAIIGLLAISMTTFASSTKKSSEELARMKAQTQATADVMEKANNVFAEQKEVVERLVKTINDHNLSNKERKKALEELIALDPKHLEGLTLANIETEKGKKIIDDYVESLHKLAIAEAAKSLDIENERKRIKAQQDLLVENKKFAEEKAALDKEIGKTETVSGAPQTLTNEQIRLTLLKNNHKEFNEEQTKIISDAQYYSDALNKIAHDNAAKDQPTFNQTSGLGQGLSIDEEAAKKAAERAKKLAAFLIDLDDKLAKARREHAAESLKEIGDDAKAVSDDEKAALDKRLQAYDIYAQTQAAIINRTAENEIVQQQKTLSRIAALKKKSPSKRSLEDVELIASEELVTQTILNIQQKRENAISNLARTSSKDRLAIIKSNQEKEIHQRLELYNSSKEADQAIYFDQLTQLEIAYEKQFQAAGKNVKKQERATQAFNNAKLVLQDKYIIEALKKDIEFAEAELEIQRAAGIDVSAQIAKLNELKLKLKEAETKAIIDANKAQVDSEKNKYDKISDFLTAAKSKSDEVFGIIGSGIKASIDSQKNALADQSKAIDENTAKQIEAVNATLASEQDKAARIAIINARAQAQKDQIAQRQRQLDIQQARFDKIKGIADIIINTAIAVTKFLAKGDIPEAIAAGVIGAAQLAVAIATPIPHFEHGTDDAPGGLALVSEKRPELIVHPDGSMQVTPNEPTVMNIPAHSVVFPDARKAMESGLAVNREGQLIDHRTYYKEMTATLSKDIKQLTKVVADKEPVILKKGKSGWEMIKGMNIHLNAK